jgi:hypothetical protein
VRLVSLSKLQDKKLRLERMVQVEVFSDAARACQSCGISLVGDLWGCPRSLHFLPKLSSTLGGREVSFQGLFLFLRSRVESLPSSNVASTVICYKSCMKRTELLMFY